MGLLDRKNYMRRGTHERTTAAVIARRTLAQQCLALRADGLTIDQIIERLSVDGSANLTWDRVAGLIDGELTARGKVDADRVKARMRDELDRISNIALRTALSKPTLTAPNLSVMIKAQERLATLDGLDAPRAIDVKDVTQHVPLETTVAEVLARLAEEDAAEQSG